MNYLGYVFRDIRLSKNYSLKEVSKGIISVSFLSKFERGNSDISLSKFSLLLDRLNLTLEEFMFISNDYKPTHLENILNNIKRAYENNDLALLLKIEEEEHEKWLKYNITSYLYNSIMIKALAHNLDSTIIFQKDDLINISDYLFSVDNWGFYEIMLFGNTMHILNKDLVITLSKELTQKTEVYKNIKKFNEEVIKVLLNTIVFCVEANKGKETQQFIQYVEKISEGTDFYFEKTKLMFLKGIYNIATGNQTIGTEMAQNAIQTMRFLGDINLANNHELYLEEKLAIIK